MGRSILKLTSLLISIAALCSCAHSIPQNTSDNWGTITNGDVSEVYSILKENHPAAVAGENPDFLKTLEDGYQSALAKSRSCNSEEVHDLILKQFSDSFHDLHLTFRHKRLGKSETRPNRTFGISDFSKEQSWIHLPTFDPNKEEISKLQRMISELKGVRSSPIIIFDLRGNDGGDSEWGTRLLKSFYGKEFYSYSISKRFPEPIIVDWRASKENTDRNKKVVEYIKETFGTHSDDFLQYSKLVEGMTSALQMNEPFFRTSFIKAKKPRNRYRSPVIGKVFVLTDSNCFSACLDFMDELFAFENVTQIGETTSADTVYMEVNAIHLRSGLGEIRYPIKVYRNRIRKSNEPYVPKYTWKGSISDTVGLEKWVSELSNASTDE